MVVQCINDTLSVGKVCLLDFASLTFHLEANLRETIRNKLILLLAEHLDEIALLQVVDLVLIVGSLRAKLSLVALRQNLVLYAIEALANLIAERSTLQIVVTEA